ncbi:MAG: glycoside hydrolase [Acidobacteria bacterium]|nr:glycoside hydrolase [Acidobacteriota bacterium]
MIGTRRAAAGLIALACIAASASAAAPPDPRLFSEMRWRCIGPFRGGRTVGAAGIPSQPNVFFMGVNNGGVWKTTDAGRTWAPIFDDQPTQSIGAIALAPSNPDILYVGSGEGLQRPDLSTGDGIYKSTDGGKSWMHLGLEDGQQIGALLVDPGNPNRVFAAVLGHPYGPNPERGVFRSTDGGQSWEKVLYRDENTGAIALAFDPKNPQVVYADLWAARQAPWEIGASFQGPGSGLYKSTDGGTTWKPLTAGLPTLADGLGRIGIAVAPSDPSRLYAQVDADAAHGGTYRSDDAGATWRRVNAENRIWGRGGDFAEIKVDPKNPDVVYAANTSTYRSTDGGRTFTAIKGAPGGDDYHTIWINPDHPEIIFLAADQGATISVNGGKTWSSWYNQPTAQFYHVITDNQFPYRVYGGQQESGSAGVSSRSDDGSIHFGDFHPVGVEEYGYVAPDPLNPDIIFGGKISRHDMRTGDTTDISPAPIRGQYRFVRTMPVLFSPLDPHLLYLGANVLFATRDGGNSWSVLSPDLTRAAWEMPASVGVFAPMDPEKGKHRGVIYTIAPSPREAGRIWVGTDDGLIHVTTDGGKTWKDVTPKALTPWSKVSLMEASHSDPAVAYAAINRFRLDDLRPHIYRTRDGGATWTEIVRGIPGNEVVNAVREDPERRGLLFAGTERGVYVSFDDGDEWRSVRNNLPATSVRDLVVHGDDLVVGTHGRSFWILDDITPLRQMAAEAVAAEVHLFRPQVATRVKRSQWPDTPLPPEEPAGQNPPDGAIVNYVLKSKPAQPVVLEILDPAGKLVRRFTSADRPEPVDPELNVPTYWIRRPAVLSAEPGMHRFVWDLHYPPPDVLEHEYPISAVPGDTPRHPVGPAVLPGTYTVRLTANGRAVTAPLTVRMDPRVKTPPEGLAQRFRLATEISAALSRDSGALTEVKAARARLKPAAEAGARKGSPSSYEADLLALEGSGGGRRGANRDDLSGLNGKLASLYAVVEGSETSPTTQAVAAWKELSDSLEKTLARWAEVKKSAGGRR